MEEREYYDNYESRLEEQLTESCGSAGRLMTAGELDEAWRLMAPEYMADAIGQINKYPAYTLAVPAFIGMALAKSWDDNWDEGAKITYDQLKSPRGFDEIDEYVMEDILGLKAGSEEEQKLSDAIRTLAHTVMTVIEHEEIESQTTKAFYIMARSAKVLFRAGVSSELARLGYRYEKLRVANPDDKVN